MDKSYCILVSPEAYIRDSLPYPPDVVHDSQKRVDETYVDSAQQEEMVARETVGTP